MKSPFRETLIQWVLRCISAYLLWFGTALYLSFMYTVSGGAIHDSDIIKAVGLGLIFSTPLFVSTFPSQRFFHQFMIGLISIMTVFYLGMVITKPVVPYLIGVLGYSLGLLYLVKIKSTHQPTP